MRYKLGKTAQKKRILFLLGLLCFFGAILSSPLRGQAIVAPGGRTLYHRATLLRSFIQINRRSLQTDGRRVEVTNYEIPTALVYGFRPGWTLIAVQPYVISNLFETSGQLTENRGLKGFSDSSFLLQYDGLFRRNSPGGLTRLAGVFGMRIPSGEEKFSTDALAYTGGLVFEKAVRLKYVLTADFQYTIATENNQGIKSGNTARFDFVPAYFLYSRRDSFLDGPWYRNVYDLLFRHGAFLVLEFNGTWMWRFHDRGQAILDTGGMTLSISPGIQYFLSDRLLLEFSAPVPVVKALNGVQLESDSKFLFGFRVLF